MNDDTFYTLLANGAEPAEVRITRPVAKWADDGDFGKPGSQEWYSNTGAAYLREGEALAEFLERHLPGGLIDSLFAALCRRKASLFSVPYSKPQEDEE